MHVHVRVSDTGWILERMASALAERLDYVSYGPDEAPSADIQYYLTYSCREKRVSRLEAAFFTHIEEEPNARAKFLAVAGEVEQPVCMSAPYAELLRREGCLNVAVIPPGVDLERFTPLVRIGVVGRTYHTGRKGERLLAQVMDAPGIEWHFTGAGWPGPARLLAPDELPDFYRSMDYILVPSLYEGGPMSVIEALACGVKVIAPPIGWVPEFPHLEYETGDAADLRRVLGEVVAERRSLRSAVLGYTWQRFAERHDALFRRLAQLHSLRM